MTHVAFLSNRPHAFRIAAAFAALFIAYQLPEGIGQRILGSFAVQATLLLAFFPVAYALGRALTGRPLEAYALHRAAHFSRPLIGLFLLAVAAKALSVAAGASLGIFAWQPARELQPQALPGLLLGLLMTFAPSLAEDIVTRGFWYRAAGIPWHPAAFVLASSAIYVGNHVYRLAAGPGEWAMLFTFGLAYVDWPSRASGPSGRPWACTGVGTTAMSSRAQSGRTRPSRRPAAGLWPWPPISPWR